MQTFRVTDCSEIRKELFDARKCVHDYSCLTGGTECLCHVRSFIGDKILFVEGEKVPACEYRIGFGLSHICSCPLRKKIYQLYSV